MPGRQQVLLPVRRADIGQSNRRIQGIPHPLRPRTVGDADHGDNSIAGDARMKHPITPDELRIAALVAQGQQDKEIARDLGVSYDAARQRLRTLAQKIGASNRAMVAAWYVRQVRP